MPSSPAKPVLPVWMRVVIVALLIGLAYVSQRDAGQAPPPKVEPSPEVPAEPVSVRVIGNDDQQHEAPRETARVEAGEGREARAANDALVIKGVALKDQSGNVVFRGDIDLEPTLERIANGKRLDRFPNDGSTFQNREKRLPRQPSGYYREYVVPTPGQNGPGPQRLVVGRDGEVFYTHDHYKSFRKVK